MVSRVQLQERDQDIFEHIRRFRMTTRDVLHRRFFSGKGLDAVTSTMRRLKRGEFIAAADLEPPRRCYYHLTGRSARMLGLPQSFGRGLGEQALPTRYAILQFCCGGDEYRQLLRPDEFRDEFPDCVAKHLPNEPYYFDSDAGVPRLALIMVDLGADAGRIIRKVRRVIGERLKVRGFREIIEQDAFLTTVVTARESKRKAIEAAQQRAEDFPYPIRIEVIDHLARVL